MTKFWNIYSSLATIVTVLLSILKLSGVITWSWIFVLSPLLLFITTVLICVCVIFIYAYTSTTDEDDYDIYEDEYE